MATFSNRNDAAALLLQIALTAYKSNVKGRRDFNLDALRDVYAETVRRLASAPHAFVAAMTPGVGIRLLC